MLTFFEWRHSDMKVKNVIVEMKDQGLKSMNYGLMWMTNEPVPENPLKLNISF